MRMSQTCVYTPSTPTYDVKLSGPAEPHLLHERRSQVEPPLVALRSHGTYLDFEKYNVISALSHLVPRGS